jgi:plastocyanin domain-containing protein
MIAPWRSILSALLAAALLPSSAGAAGCAADDPDRCEGGRKAPAWATVQEPRLVEIALEPGGFVPSQVAVKRGVPVRFVIRRTKGNACASGLTILGLDVAARIPSGKSVEFVITPGSSGVYPVACRGEGVAGLLIVG